MANYNASGLVTLAKLAEEAKAKKETEKDMCDMAEEPKECMKRRLEAFSDCD